MEYVIPNFITYGQKIDDITLSMELGSEAPGYNEDWPSDIHFLLDGIPIAMWTAPGDYGAQRGIFTPDWWYEDWNQYGLLKTLQINHRGTFIDGVRKSDVTIDTFGYTDKSTIHLRLSVPEDAEHVGGLTIFGRSFGNYSQDIRVRITYSPISASEGSRPVSAHTLPARE